MLILSFFFDIYFAPKEYNNNEDPLQHFSKIVEKGLSTMMYNIIAQ